MKHTMLPMLGPRAMAASVSCYRVVQVDVRAPFDKGRRRLTDGTVLQSRRARQLPRRNYCQVHAWGTPWSWGPTVSDSGIYRIQCGGFGP